MHRLFIGICLATLAATAGIAQVRSEASAAKWREDIAVFRRELPQRHKNLFHSMSQEEFETAVGVLSGRAQEFSDHQIVVELARIVARVGDGHTYIDLTDPALGFHVLPLRLQLFRDGLFVVAAAEEYASLVGKRVTRFGETGVEDALREATEITPRDNDSGVRAHVVLHLAIPEVLEGLGVIPSAKEASLTVDDAGTTKTATLTPVTFEAAGKMSFADARGKGTPPLYLSDTSGTVMLGTSKNFWFEYLEASKLLYVKFNAVYWSDEDSPGSFFGKVFDFVDTHPVDKLVIDLRHNSGGNNTLILPIIHGIIRHDAINRRGRLFAIIGRQTFSAAQNFVNLLEKHTSVLFAGEASGGAPNHYGDPESVLLPNSKITVRVSTLWWQDVHPKDTRAATLPQIAIEESSQDYKADRDPVLEALAAWKTLTERVTAALEKGGLQPALAEYRSYKDDPRHRYQDTEVETNEIGYSLLKRGQLDPAIAILEANAQAYPASSNVYDSLGDAYAKKGSRDLAIASYEKTLELNPRNFWVRKLLADLKGQTKEGARP